MKKEYDFSKGKRGKFYRPDAELYLPRYIEPEMMERLRKFSKKKGVKVFALKTMDSRLRGNDGKEHTGNL